MVYGHYIEDTAGNKRFFVEGCSYCRMSTGGQHESTCPMRDTRVSEELAKQQKLTEIRERGHEQYGKAWQYLANQ